MNDPTHDPGDDAAPGLGPESAPAEPDCCLVMTTFDDAAVGDRLIAALLEARLAACIQVLPIRSHYRWEGEIRHDDESLAIVKTTRQRIGAIRDVIDREHSYETPEMVVVPIVDGSPDYLSWMRGECGPSGGGEGGSAGAP